MLKESGKLDEAMAAYDKAVAAKNVNLVRAHYSKGSLFLAKKEFDKAAETLSAITPPDGSGALAEAYLAMGRPSSPRRTSRRAARTSPSRWPASRASRPRARSSTGSSRT